MGIFKRVWVTLLVFLITHNFAFASETTNCIAISHERTLCASDGVYTYSFAVTNHFNGTANWLMFSGLPSGAAVNGDTNAHFILLSPALQQGQGTNLTVTISHPNIHPPERFCFKLSTHNLRMDECCAIDHCIELKSCCAEITDECVRISTNNTGVVTYTFNYQNLSPIAVSHILVSPDTNWVNCFTPQLVILPSPLPTGGITAVTVNLTISSNCGPNICLFISGHDENYAECCSERRCITLPSNCCRPRTYTLNQDFDLGTLVNLNHQPSDQLQLNGIAKPFPYVNVACANRGTAVRIDINTGQVLGEYKTAPNGMGTQPSRTTVDKFGNVWVANRAEFSVSPAIGGTPKGSVVRIGLIIGGTRGIKDSFGNFVANPSGPYLAPPYIYNTCVDRDSDGLIKTSSGLGDILPWANTGGVDSDGGVSTAEDEAITIYTRVNGTGTRFIGIDCDNNVWTGGTGNYEFQLLDGFSGLPIPGMQFNAGLGVGGYGGLVDGNGNLWSANSLMRFVPNSMVPPGVGSTLPYWVYGIGINPLNCHVFSSSTWAGSTNHGLAEFDPAGNLVNSYPAVGGGGGLCVDANGHIWVSQGNQVAHLAPSGPGHVLVGFITADSSNVPFSFVWGAAVDSNGKIWVTDAARDLAMRIDPSLAAGVGAVDMMVPLGANAYPYNYSDMTGFVELSATCRSGFWSIIHDGCSVGNLWGKLTWNSQEPAGTSITVEVRAADVQANLPSIPWTQVKNGASFCGSDIKGRYLEVRVSFNAPGCTQESPILYDLTIDCCPSPVSSCDKANELPRPVRCPDPITICDVSPNGGPTPVTVSVNVTDANGDPLTVTFREGSNPPLATVNIAASGPPTVGTATFTASFTPGTHVIIMAIDDGHGRRDVCDIIIHVGDKTPPQIECPPGVKKVGFKGSIPQFQPLLLSDNCTPSNQIVWAQSPAAGTTVPAGNHTVLLIATDLAGNSATCQTFYAVSPQIQINKPVKYSEFDAPTNITIEATVSSEAGEVRAVHFYFGSRLIDTATNTPYRVTAALSEAGMFGLRAIAVDSLGFIAASDPVQIVVDGVRTVPTVPLAIPIQTQNAMKFAIPTQSNLNYILECSPSLSVSTPTVWTVIQSFEGTGGTVVVNDDFENRPSRYYRLRAVPR